MKTPTIQQVAHYAEPVAKTLAEIDALLGDVGFVHTADEAVQAIAALLKRLADTTSKPVTKEMRDASIARLDELIAENTAEADAEADAKFGKRA